MLGGRAVVNEAAAEEFLVNDNNVHHPQQAHLIPQDVAFQAAQALQTSNLALQPSAVAFQSTAQEAASSQIMPPPMQGYSSRRTYDQDQPYIHKALRHLIRKHVHQASSSTEEQRKGFDINGREQLWQDKMFDYCIQILSSHVAVPSMVQDDLHIANTIKKTLIQEDKEIAGGNDDLAMKRALTFSHHYMKLKNLKYLAKPWATLYFMQAVASDARRSGSRRVGMGLLQQIQPIIRQQHSSALTKPINKEEYGTATIQNSVTANDAWMLPLPHGQEPPLPSVQLVAKSDMKNNMWLQYLDLQKQRSDISEEALVRDLLYVLQGIDGQHVRFHASGPSRSIERVVVNPKVRIAKSVRALVARCSEPGWHYRRIMAIIKPVTDDDRGLVWQSFTCAIKNHLTRYAKWLAVLETHMQGAEEGDQAALTLRRLLAWQHENNDLLSMMRLLSVLCDCVQDKKGGALLHTLHAYQRHGDPYVRDLVTNLMTDVAIPFWRCLERWVYHGVLEDPFDEFFVRRQQEPSSRSATSSGQWEFWRDAYKMDDAMVPGFVSPSLAKKIFLIGKSINFIRRHCLDTDWQHDTDTTSQRELCDDITALEVSVDAIYRDTSRHLLNLMHDRYGMMQHIEALRKYLLCGQGDFIQMLMDALGEDLSKPAKTLYRHNLTGVLEAAIRSSNAQYDPPAVLDRLDVRLLRPSPGDQGWDVFSLDYHVTDSPIRTLFTPRVMEDYLQLFHFLWRLRRLSHVLSTTWRRLKTPSNADLPALGPVMHRYRLYAHEMLHFVTELQHYVLFEVLECSWIELTQTLEKREGDLDGVIKAHQKYLRRLVTKCLLGDPKSPKCLLPKLYAIFKIILDMRSIGDNLDKLSEDMTFRAKNVSASSSLTGGWSQSNRTDAMASAQAMQDAEALNEMQGQMDDMYQRFQSDIKDLLQSLSRHHDISLKFLSFRVNFNEYYNDYFVESTV